MTHRPHRAESCRDKDCPLPYCQIWREAWADGYQTAEADFYQPRYDEGYAKGLADQEPQIIYVEVSSS